MFQNWAWRTRLVQIAQRTRNAVMENADAQKGIEWTTKGTVYQVMCDFQEWSRSYLSLEHPCTDKRTADENVTNHKGVLIVLMVFEPLFLGTERTVVNCKEISWITSGLIMLSRCINALTRQLPETRKILNWLEAKALDEIIIYILYVGSQGNT